MASSTRVGAALRGDRAQTIVGMQPNRSRTHQIPYYPNLVEIYMSFKLFEIDSLDLLGVWRDHVYVGTHATSDVCLSVSRSLHASIPRSVRLSLSQ